MDENPAEIVVFEFEKFEQLGKPNGIVVWTETQLREALGYQDPKAFRATLLRAMQACLSLGIDTGSTFIFQGDGQDYHLTRFACYLITMNADPKKQAVAAAQVYFAALADTFHSQREHFEGIERVIIRGEVTDGEKSLSSAASQHGVVNYPFFQNAGYRGMYNMNLTTLKDHKGVGDKECLLDRMNKTELAAHLFRITQTEAKIKKENITGQRHLEHAANEVGKTVRSTVIKISGTAPENLPIAEPIKDVKKKLKSTDKNFKSIDSKKKPKK